jgi:hemoglobin-like flavoprotein
MTSQEIALIRTSYRQIAPMSEQAAAMFYARLFELDPSLRALFAGDPASQSRQLMHTIGQAVNSLDRPDTLAPAVRQLGLRHAGHHVKERDYEAFGAALLWTLAKGLGDDFTTEMHLAWSKTYWMLSETMKAGARDGAAQIRRAVA